MADPSRFPKLALPFAVVGACAGWLSVRMLQNPLIDLMCSGDPALAALCALGSGAATGALLTRLCVGRRYAYEIGAPNPDIRPSTDVWPLHVGAVLLAGAATGATFLWILQVHWNAAIGAFGGFVSAAFFLPVCMSVLSSARRAQRARLGSLVAGSDRRAVWGILAVTLAVATLEVILDWPAAARVGAPFPAVAMLLAAAIVTALIRASDAAALGRVRATSTADLERKSQEEIEVGGMSIPRLDLGLGTALHARVTRGASAYRGGDRLAALVEGSPEQAAAALARAVRRGTLGLLVIGAISALHVAAITDPARDLYQAIRCDGRPSWYPGCALAERAR